jgi:hypothetical protein
MSDAPGDPAETVADPDRRGRNRRVRRITTWVLTVLTAISVLAGTVAFWTHRTVFDTGHYMSLVGPLVDDPAVTAALSTYLTDQAVTALDLDNRITEAIASIPDLPERAKPIAPLIAGPVADNANERIHRFIDNYVHSQEFRNLWTRVNQVGHEKVVALLRGDYEKLPNVVVGDEEVRLNLISVITQILRGIAERGIGPVPSGTTLPTVSIDDVPRAARQKVSTALGVTLPDDFGQVTIMSKDKLSQWQSIVNGIDRMVWGLLVLSLVLAVATVVVAVNRRTALIRLGIAVAAALLLAAALIGRIRDSVLEKVKEGQGRDAARSIVDNTLHDLRGVVVAVIVIALLVALVVYLAGRPRWLLWLIASVRGLATERPDLATSNAWIAEHIDVLPGNRGRRGRVAPRHRRRRCRFSADPRRAARRLPVGSSRGSRITPRPEAQSRVGSYFPWPAPSVRARSTTRAPTLSPMARPASLSVRQWIPPQSRELEASSALAWKSAASSGNRYASVVAAAPE